MGERACGKCGGTSFYEVDRATVRHHESVNAVEALSLVAVEVPSGKGGLLGRGKEMKEVTVRAVICAGCGHAELYARDLDLLAQLAKLGAGDVRRN